MPASKPFNGFPFISVRVIPSSDAQLVIANGCIYLRFNIYGQFTRKAA